jgi:hypothetical protein
MCGAVDLRSIFVSIIKKHINQFSLMYKEVDLWRFDVRTVDVVSGRSVDLRRTPSEESINSSSVLGQANHSFTPNSRYLLFFHPRFGHIPAIQAIQVSLYLLQMNIDFNLLYSV